MNKKQIKHIREIAERLPSVLEQCISGYTIEDDKVVPNIYNVEVNHERRLRKAYERNGLDGIKAYLEMISNLQKQRHENFVQQGDRDSGWEASSDEDGFDVLEMDADEPFDIIDLDETEDAIGT